MTHLPKVDEQIILSDGEDLSQAPWSRLVALFNDPKKLSKKLSSNDRVGPRSADARHADDLSKVGREIKRRKALTTLSLCGLQFSFQEEWLVSDGPRYKSLDAVPKSKREFAVMREEKRIHVLNRETRQMEPVGDVVCYWEVRTKLFQLVRVPSLCRFGSSNPVPNEIYLTLADINEYMTRGAILHTSADPLAEWTPWKVLDYDPEALDASDGGDQNGAN